MIDRRTFSQMLGASAISAAAMPVCSRILPGGEQGAPERPGGLRVLTPGHLVVSPAQRRGDVSPLLFGCSLEWTDHGNFIYDPERRALRRDVLDLLAPLRIPVWRFPGGIMADHYHWRDGVGPPDRRPVGQNPMDGTEHPHTFGTDEFITLLDELSAEALVTANVGTGTYEELEAWADHFSKAGRPVRHWELGNEIYLAEPRRNATIPGNDDRIYHTSREYAEKAAAWAANLRRRHPDALIGGIAGTTNTSRENVDWLDVLLERAVHELDFVALHNAFAPLVIGRYDFSRADRRRDAYRAMSAQVQESVADTALVASRLREASPQRPVRLAITEHFPLFGFGGGEAQLHAVLDQSRTMAAAIYTAGLFHAWMRQGVSMANYNLALSRWFGALITDTPEGLIRTPTYHAFDLYRNRFGTRLIDVTASVPGVNTPKVGAIAARADVPLLDVVAALDDADAVTLAVICREFDQPVEATIEGMAPADVEVWTLEAPMPEAISGPGLTTTTRSSSLSPRTSRWNYTPATRQVFPPNSITVMRWPPQAAS
jgi:alpha-L-arabinofuranosidase